MLLTQKKSKNSISLWDIRCIVQRKTWNGQILQFHSFLRNFSEKQTYIVQSIYFKFVPKNNIFHFPVFSCFQFFPFFSIFRGTRLTFKNIITQMETYMMHLYSKTLSLHKAQRYIIKLAKISHIKSLAQNYLFAKLYSFSVFSFHH